MALFLRFLCCVGDMQKDFKIGLAIGVTLAAGAVLWLATLPNLRRKSPCTSGRLRFRERK